MTNQSDDQDAPKPVTLLLVEEDDLAAKRLFEMLRRPEGTQFEISRVPGVEEALAKLQNDSYDVFLSFNTMQRLSTIVFEFE